MNALCELVKTYAPLVARILLAQLFILSGVAKIGGFEALMRWKHPQKGMISPGIFIPVA